MPMGAVLRLTLDTLRKWTTRQGISRSPVEEEAGGGRREAGGERRDEGGREESEMRSLMRRRSQDEPTSKQTRRGRKAVGDGE